MKAIVSGLVRLFVVSVCAIIFLSPLLGNTTLSPIVSEPLPHSLQVLNKKVTVDWVETPFIDTIIWMRERVGWNVIVGWRELATMCVDEDTPVTLQLHNVPVGFVLSELAKKLSPDLSFRINENALEFSSRLDFMSRVYVKAYSAIDLLVTSTPAPASIEVKTDMSDSSLEEFKYQIEQIFLNIMPETWRINGGKGSISWIGITVVVINAVEVHEKIADLTH